LRGGKASVDAWIALRVTFVAAKAFEVTLVERTRHILENMSAGKRTSDKQKGGKREKEEGKL
jgi:hypothetical protein